MKKFCRQLGLSQFFGPAAPAIPRQAPPAARTSSPNLHFPEIPAAPVTLPAAPDVDLVNLQPDTLAMAENVVREALQRGWNVEITSGYRDPSYQLALRARWDAGDRAGLRVRPARSSAHSRGEAVDLVVLEDPDGRKLQQLGLWAQRRGYRWGGTFSVPDPVHFATGGPRRE